MGVWAKQVAGRGVLMEHWLLMGAAWTPKVCWWSFSSPRRGEAILQKVQITPCRTVSILIRATRYP